MDNVSLSSIPSSAIVQNYDIIYNIIALHIIGVAGLVTNISILLIIKKHKDLQTPCFLLIAGECFCSIMLALGKFLNAVLQAAQYVGQLSDARSRGICYLLRTLIPAWGIFGSIVVPVTISLDRLISVLYPMRYRLLGKRYAYACLSVCYIFATAAALSGIVDYGSPQAALSADISCTVYFSPFTPTFLRFYGIFNMSVSLFCVLLYGIMLVSFEWRYRQLMADSIAQNFVKQQAACMSVIKLLMAFYTVTSVGPEICVTILGACDVHMSTIHL